MTTAISFRKYLNLHVFCISQPYCDLHNVVVYCLNTISYIHDRYVFCVCQICFHTHNDFHSIIDEFKCCHLFVQALYNCNNKIYVK